MSCTVVIACAHDAPPGIVTLGQLEANPICVGVRSAPPPHQRSGPPHALPLPPLFPSLVGRSLVSALALFALAFASGQGPGLTLLTTASLHFCSAFIFACTNFAVDCSTARLQATGSALAGVAARPSNSTNSA